MIKKPGFTEENAIKSGSPQSGEPLSVAIGKIRRPHGVKGEVIFEPYPEYFTHLKKGQVLMIGKKHEAYTIHSIRAMDQNYLISFDGLLDCDKAGFLRNQLVYLRTEDLDQHPLGKHYPHQVLGMQVVDENGENVGRLEEVLLTGANDVYVVKKEDSIDEILLPAIDSVILNVDEEKKVITVKLPIWD
jgi:16S rRNA processing protein RimM